MSARQHRTDKGFTLIELLVVVLIIGILSAIAIPVFMNQKAKAVDSTVRSDLKATATNVETYLAGGATWDDLRTATGATKELVFLGAGATSAAPNWNSFPALPGSPVSRGTRASLIIPRVEDLSVNWRSASITGEYCLWAQNGSGSRYDGSGSGVAAYAHRAYWDSKLGGAVTWEELLAAATTGLPAACEGFARQYLGLA